MSVYFTPTDLTTINQKLEQQHPLEILRWTYQNLERVDIGTSLGPAGITIIHLAKQLVHTPNVFLLDTDFLFPHTLRLKTQIEQQLNLEITIINSTLSPQQQAEHYGDQLWKTNPNQCCTLRKVRPLQQHLNQVDAWINGVRRQQGHQRQSTPILTAIQTNTGHSLIKVSPLAHWTRKEVWQYIDRHQLPYNELHDQGYPSIGCMPCTQAISLTHDEQERQGRWGNSNKTECGIHTFHHTTEVANL